jgi:hypothetical protein
LLLQVIRLYSIEGDDYLEIVKWQKHQKTVVAIENTPALMILARKLARGREGSRRTRTRRPPAIRRLSASQAIASGTRLPLRRCPLCVPAQSLRAFMSSIIHRRSGLTASILIGNSCLG